MLFRSYSTGNSMDLVLGENSIDITSVVILGNQYTFIEAWRDLGYRGIRIYKSGFESTPGIIEADNAQIIIEGDWEIGRPTPRSLLGGVSHNVNEPAVFEWTHNGSFDQTEFDLRYRPVGSSEWITITEITSSQSYTLPAGELSLGEYEWQVRTRTKYGYQSPWSSLSVFMVAELPATPVITRPVEGEEIGVSDLHIEWEAAEQDIYEIELLDASGNIVDNASGQSPNKRNHTFEGVLENNSNYTVRLRVAVSGLYSAWAEVNFSVSYTEPAKPELVFVPDNEKSTITVYIENPAPTGTEPNVTTQDLYRRRKGKNTWTKLAEHLQPNGFFIDYTPAHDTEYEYYVFVRGDNETRTNSDTFTSSVKVKHVLLSLANNLPEQVRLYMNPDKTFDTSFNATTKRFAGRRFPVTEFGETLETTGSISYLVREDTLDRLHDFLKRQETLLYRDSRGRKKFVTVSNISVNDHQLIDLYTVDLSLTEVDYHEGVTDD